MTLVEILLVILILAVLYAAQVIQKRIRQMDAMKVDILQAQRERAFNPFNVPTGPNMRTISTSSPSAPPNPKVAKLETQLDKLRSMKLNRRKRTDFELKEKELIGKMVEIFIKESDEQYRSEKVKTQQSGSAT